MPKSITIDHCQVEYPQKSSIKIKGWMSHFESIKWKKCIWYFVFKQSMHWALINLSKIVLLQVKTGCFLKVVDRKDSGQVSVN